MINRRVTIPPTNGGVLLVLMHLIGRGSALPNNATTCSPTLHLFISRRRKPKRPDITLTHMRSRIPEEQRNEKEVFSHLR